VDEGIHVLLVDDDRALATLLSRYLTERGVQVSAIARGGLVDEQLRRGVDLMILDVMLPGEDGLSIARRVRVMGGPPIIMISARGEEVDRVLGLEIGADDYLAKPFSPRELLARIRAVLRRALHNRETSGGQALVFGPYRLDPNTRELHKGASLIHLTTGEYALLEAFVHRPNRVLSRDRLLDLVRGLERSPFDRSIDLRITRLRRKIEPDPRHPSFIRTVRGAGYLFSPRGGESVR